MTRRWLRTGSACRPATRCRNAGSPRCSDARPAAGREPESPRHDRNRRSQTRRASQSRLTRKQGPPAVSADAIVTAPGRSGIGTWRSARCAWVNLDAMSVKAWPGWAGIPRRDYAAAVRFFGETLGLDVAFDARTTVELTAGKGDRIQLFGPGRRYFEFYRNHGARIVPLLELDDPDQASAELARGGAELLGRPESAGTWTWLTFRIPDGTSTAWAPACLAGRSEDSGRTRSICGTHKGHRCQEGVLAEVPLPSGPACSKSGSTQGTPTDRKDVSNCVA